MKIAYVIGALLIGGSFASLASAAPLTGKQAAADKSLVSKVATFICTRDDHGWHYMRGDARVTCRPVRPSGAMWGWRCEGPRCGWWHRNEHRWND
jgi:hypothetical protein